MFLLLGSLTKDRIIINNSRKDCLGGAVYYQSFVYDNFKLDYLGGLTLSSDDIELLNEFSNTDSIKPIFKDETINFINEYCDKNSDERKQSSNFSNIPIEINDIKSIIDENDFDAIILNTILKTDFKYETYEYLKSLNIPIYLSIQGLLRDCDDNGNIILKYNTEINKIISNIQSLFLDQFEAKLIFNDLSIGDIARKLSNDFNINEVIITCGSGGSLIYLKDNNEIYKIKAIKPEKIIDSTGCGDTYMASYISRRLSGHNCKDSGLFASLCATIKLENGSYFNKSLDYVEDRLKDIAN